MTIKLGPVKRMKLEQKVGGKWHFRLSKYPIQKIKIVKKMFSVMEKVYI